LFSLFSPFVLIFAGKFNDAFAGLRIRRRNWPDHPYDFAGMTLASSSDISNDESEARER